MFCPILVCLALVVPASCSLASSAQWSIAENKLQLNGENVVLHGLGTTCTEYLLRGIGMTCFATYDWRDGSQIINTVNNDQVSALLGYLTDVKSDSVVPVVRIPMTASYWLNVVTKAAGHNFAKYPSLSQGYRTLISKLVKNYTDAGVVTILDLHWNDDDAEQQQMALKSDRGADSLKFWDSVASTFKDNRMVFYELYNEPHISDMNAYVQGNSQVAGMLEMRDAVRKHSADAVLIIAGAAGWAYDADSLLTLDKHLNPQENVMWNLHPYTNAPNKCPAGYESLLKELVSSTHKPIIVTEFGQACSPTDGPGQGCPSTGMGYDETIISISAKYSVSWLPWAWQPSSKAPNFRNCQTLNGGTIEAPDSLKLVHVTNGKGADFETLWSKYGPGKFRLHETLV